MVNPQKQYVKLIKLLDDNSVEYKLFEHRVALTYEDLAVVQKETGFFGTEGKCMVLKTDNDFIVYITLQGKRINMDVVKKVLDVSKIRLAIPEELKETFGTEPGCAYPFGFDEDIKIFIDPDIYKQEWFLFSPVLPTRTVQVRGVDLKKVFDNLKNSVQEVTDWNQ
ncbi:MAG: YbaK/EbsC family protein [Patescibacteria group bacterium]